MVHCEYLKKKVKRTQRQRDDDKYCRSGARNCVAGTEFKKICLCLMLFMCVCVCVRRGEIMFTLLVHFIDAQFTRYIISPVLC